MKKLYVSFSILMMCVSCSSTGVKKKIPVRDWNHRMNVFRVELIKAKMYAILKSSEGHQKKVVIQKIKI